MQLYKYVKHDLCIIINYCAIKKIDITKAQSTVNNKYYNRYKRKRIYKRKYKRKRWVREWL